MNEVKEIELRLIKQPSMKYTQKGSNIPLIPKATKSERMIGVGIGKDGKTTTICFDRTESSIYLKDHRDPSPDKTTIESLTFEYFRTTINANDKLKLEFIRNWGANLACKESIPGSNPIFYEYNYADEAEQDMKKDRAFTKAKNLCYEAPDADILAYAAFKGFTPDPIMLVTRRNIKATINEGNAAKFVEEFESEKTKRYYRFTEALDDGELLKDEFSKTILWGSSRTPVITYGDQHPIDALVNFSMRKEGERFWENINSSIGESLIPKEEVKTEITTVGSSENLKMPIAQQVDEAIQQGIITESADGSYFFGSKCGNTKEKLIEHILARPAKIEKLEEALKLR